MWWEEANKARFRVYTYFSAEKGSEMIRAGEKIGTNKEHAETNHPTGDFKVIRHGQCGRVGGG